MATFRTGIASQGKTQEGHVPTAGKEKMSSQTPSCDDKRSGSDPATAKEDKKVGQYSRKTRILVTGFHDWTKLGLPPNIHRIKDNPSGRMLVGKACDKPPLSRNGPLASLLRKNLPKLEFHFQTLPVLWNMSATIDYSSYDIAIHIGLGIPDIHYEIMVEDGAYNMMVGYDAIGIPARGKLSNDTKLILRDSNRSGMLNSKLNGKTYKVTQSDSKSDCIFTVKIARARKENSFICNQTHWRALQALKDSVREEGRLKGVHFIHVPQFDFKMKEGESNLATAVSLVIEDLINIDMASEPKLVEEESV